MERWSRGELSLPGSVFSSPGKCPYMAFAQCDSSKCSSYCRIPFDQCQNTAECTGWADPLQTRKLSGRQRAPSVSRAGGREQWGPCSCAASPTPALCAFHSMWGEIYPGWLLRPSQPYGGFGVFWYVITPWIEKHNIPR